MVEPGEGSSQRTAGLARRLFLGTLATGTAFTLLHPPALAKSIRAGLSADRPNQGQRSSEFQLRAGFDPGEVEGNFGFGESVAMGDGTAVISAPGEPAVYVFDRVGASWEREAKLTVGSENSNRGFGTDVALDNEETVLVGAPASGGNDGAESGRCYVFSRSDREWNLQMTLAPDDGDGLPRFGGSVSLDRNTALVGVDGGRTRSGRAYVFTRGASGWGRSGQLAHTNESPGNHFGHDVALDGDTALVSAPGVDVGSMEDAGTVYVYTRAGDSWTLQTELVSHDLGAGDDFGTSVAIDGTTVLVGAVSVDTEDVDDAGAAYVFTGSGPSWSEQSKLLAEDPASGARFGVSVALDGRTALVGAPESSLEQETDVGAAYAFTRSGDEWHQQKIPAVDPFPFPTAFGFAVDLHDEAALVGAPLHSPSASGRPVGAAWLFGRGFSRDEISNAKYGLDFAGLSTETAGALEELYNRQPFAAGAAPETVFTRDELAQERHRLDFHELSRSTTLAIEDEFDTQFGPLPTNPPYDRDQIAMAKYDLDFAGLSTETAGEVEELYNRQPFADDRPPMRIRTRDEFAEERHGLEFDELSRPTTIAIQDEFDSQFRGPP